MPGSFLLRGYLRLPKLKTGFAKAEECSIAVGQVSSFGSGSWVMALDGCSTWCRSCAVSLNAARWPFSYSLQY